MGGGLEADLSHGAVAALWSSSSGSAPAGWRPVLQVADVRRMVEVVMRYSVKLSDGVHTLPGRLAISLNPLVRDGALRRGSVIRVLQFVCDPIENNRRVIIVIQLEVLQTECALISSPMIYEAASTQPTAISCSGGLGSHEPCVLLGAQQVVDNTSFVPGQFISDSSFAPREEHDVYDLQYGGCYGSVPPQNTVDAKMQQLSLDDHQKKNLMVTTNGGFYGSVPSQNTIDAKMHQLSLDDRQKKRLMVTANCDKFGRGGSYGTPLPYSYLLPPSMCTDRSHAPTNEPPFHVIPVAALSPYQFRWTIKVRVTAKTDLRHYSNARGPGKVFSFDLRDAQGGEIRVTCFNSQVDRYFDLIDFDKVYWVSRGTVKPADKKYNPLNSDYQIAADDNYRNLF
ncbi:hypothetical protein EJB05_34391, partial [Eragrostis curvula]